MSSHKLYTIKKINKDKNNGNHTKFSTKQLNQLKIYVTVVAYTRPKIFIMHYSINNLYRQS